MDSRITDFLSDPRNKEAVFESLLNEDKFKQKAVYFLAKKSCHNHGEASSITKSNEGQQCYLHQQQQHQLGHQQQTPSTQCSEIYNNQKYYGTFIGEGLDQANQYDAGAGITSHSQLPQQNNVSQTCLDFSGITFSLPTPINSDHSTTGKNWSTRRVSIPASSS